MKKLMVIAAIAMMAGAAMADVGWYSDYILVSTAGGEPQGGIAVPLSRAHLRHYAVSGLFGMALANLVGFTSLQHVPAGFFVLLVPLSPILTVLGASLLGSERATPRRVLGTVLGLAGILLAMSPGAALPDPARTISFLTSAACTTMSFSYRP